MIVFGCIDYRIDGVYLLRYVNDCMEEGEFSEARDNLAALEEDYHSAYDMGTDEADKDDGDLIWKQLQWDFLVSLQVQIYHIAYENFVLFILSLNFCFFWIYISSDNFSTAPFKLCRGPATNDCKYRLLFLSLDYHSWACANVLLTLLCTQYVAGSI